MEEHALLRHGQEEGGEQSDGGEHQRELGDAVVGQELQADQDLTQYRAHRVAQKLHAAAVRCDPAVPLGLHHAAREEGRGGGEGQRV